jgi:hypothetical protein
MNKEITAGLWKEWNEQNNEGRKDQKIHEGSKEHFICLVACSA